MEYQKTYRNLFPKRSNSTWFRPANRTVVIGEVELATLGPFPDHKPVGRVRGYSDGRCSFHNELYGTRPRVLYQITGSFVVVKWYPKGSQLLPSKSGRNIERCDLHRKGDRPFRSNRTSRCFLTPSIHPP